ncbi:MAG: DUF4271 domain-containing protein [Cryomorphaceae bacterium]|nr:DUF4271 domain-containing protein [Cryomorphaceae bacterium]
MEERVYHYIDWVFITLLLSGGLMLYVKLVFPRRFSDLSSLERMFVKPLDPDYEKSRTGVFELITTVQYLVVLSLLIMRWLHLLNIREASHTDWQIFLQVLFGLGLYISLRNLVIKLISKIFEVEFVGDWWLEYLNYYRISAGIWLMPLVFLSFYFWSGAWFFGLLSVGYLSVFMGRTLYKAIMEIRSKGHISLVRILLYLCTLEIAPLIWLFLWLLRL